MESSAIALISEPGLTQLSTCPIVLSGSAMSGLDEMVMDEIETQMRRAASLSSSGALARKGGDEAAADGYFREAFGLMLEVANRTANGEQNPFFAGGYIHAAGGGDVNYVSTTISLLF